MIMAYFFGDGFDLYTNGVDLVGHWDAASLNPGSSGFSAGRFTGSRSINYGSPTKLIRASGANDSVHHFVFAIMCSNITGSSLGTYFELDDGTTAQCSVVIRSDGFLFLTAGAPNGTTLAAWPTAIPLSNVWYAFEVEVVVHNTNGSISVRRNGSLINDFFQGGLDTAATANNYANRLSTSTWSAATFLLDDLLWRSDASSVPWVGDIRCYTRMPVSDVSTQFSHTTTPVSQALNGTAFGSSFSPNTAFYARFVAGFGGLVTGASVNCNVSGGGSTGHMKFALFAVAASGSVGALLATSTEVTNPGVAIITVTFPTPVRVERGQSYFLGINTDATTTYNISNTGSSVVTAASYATWPTSSPGGTVTSNNLPGTFTVITTPGTNADVVNEPQQDALSNFVYSAVNGQADFYTVGSIVNIPVSILGVTTRGYFTKTDAGTRNATVQLKSGATTLQGPSTTFSPGVWTWVERLDLVDPATGVEWTAAGVNTINIGPIVTA